MILFTFSCFYLPSLYLLQLFVWIRWNKYIHSVSFSLILPSSLPIGLSSPPTPTRPWRCRAAHGHGTSGGRLPPCPRCRPPSAPPPRPLPPSLPPLSSLSPSLPSSRQLRSGGAPSSGALARRRGWGQAPPSLSHILCVELLNSFSLCSVCSCATANPSCLFWTRCVLMCSFYSFNCWSIWLPYCLFCEFIFSLTEFRSHIFIHVQLCLDVVDMYCLTCAIGRRCLRAGVYWCTNFVGLVQLFINSVSPWFALWVCVLFWWV